MLYEIFVMIVVVVIVVVDVDVFGFLHKRRYGARCVFDDVRFKFVQFRECLRKTNVYNNYNYRVGLG